MGAFSKDLVIMLIICIPLILFHVSLFPVGGLIILGAVVFELLIAGAGSYIVWKSGGFEEAITRMLEVTRAWDGKPDTGQDDHRIPQKFCRHCGAKSPRESEFCEECGKRLG